ncbi:MAG: 5'-nucleotidase C-terminal domain-containing protein [Bacteroidetes bacterium]|nr:5'-nucleotidase C-terminal domain-containing protein [Bacteroidota bacterium]
MIRHSVLKCLAVLLLLLAGCAQSPLHVSSHSEQWYPINQAQPADSSLTQLLRPYRQGVDTQMDVIIAHTDIPLTKAQPECRLGNFMADAMLLSAQKMDPKVVAAISNYGGIRVPYIAPGPITRGKLYELMPFDNMLTIVEIPGDTLQKFCEVIAHYRGWPVSGIRFVIDGKKAKDILIAGQPLNGGRIYKIAINDYIARGGDNCDFLRKLPTRFSSVFVRDALIHYAEDLEHQGKPLHPPLDNRIRYAE